MEDDAEVAPDAVLPPYSRWGGRPARLLGSLPECYAQLAKDAALSYYACFGPNPPPAQPQPLASPLPPLPPPQ